MTVVINGSTGVTAPGTQTFGSGTALGGATNPIVSMAQGATGYVQSYIVNNTNGTSSSADIVAYPSNGTDSHGWVDMGITSLSYADTTYTVTGPNESYLFASAPSGSSTTGNLVIATDNTGTANSIQFYTNGFTQAKSAARMTIDSSGNVLVGGTSITGSGRVKVVSGAPGAGGVSLSTWDSANYYPMQFVYGASQVGTISATSTATAYNTSSDYRLKENVQPIQGALAKVAQLKPCTYKWKVDGSDGEGFIAHELAEVVPHCVTGEKDAVNEDGTPNYQGIDTSFLVATLTAAIQEQQAIIEQLRADVAQLKGTPQ